jgi:hypothetical protein
MHRFTSDARGSARIIIHSRWNSLTWRHCLAISGQGIFDAATSVGPPAQAGRSCASASVERGVFYPMMSDGCALSRSDAEQASGSDRWSECVNFDEMFKTYDYFLLPSAQIFSFDADVHWPQ